MSEANNALRVIAFKFKLVQQLISIFVAGCAATAPRNETLTNNINNKQVRFQFHLSVS